MILFYDWLRFEALTAVNIKIAVFWDMTPCSVVDIHQLFRGLFFYLEDCGSRFIRNVGSFPPD
jgi:hypothetical protein